MILTKLEIDTMGPLQGQRLTFGEGLNLCQGEAPLRGALFQFIGHMLYGTGRKREEFRGTLWLREGDKTYRLRRSVNGKEEGFQFLGSAGEVLPEQELGSHLGIGGRASFENELHLLPLKSTAGPDIARELGSFVSSHLDTGDRNLHLDKAKQFLKMHRKDYADRTERAGKRHIQEKEKLKARMEEVDGEVQRLKGQEAKAQEAFSNEKSAPQKERRRGKKNSEQELKALHKQKNLRYFLSVLGFFLMITCLFLLVLSLGKNHCLGYWILLGIGLAGGLSLGLESLLMARRLVGKAWKVQSRQAQTQREYRRQDERKQMLAHRVEELRQKEKEREADLLNLQEEFDRFALDAGRPRGEEAEMEAIDMALSRLVDLSEGQRQRREGAFIERATETFHELTGGLYDSLLLREGKLQVKEGERLIDPERLPRERQEQLFLALQLAAASGEEALPLIGEDLFRSYTDETLEETLRYLAKSKRQVVLYVTTTRESDTLEELEIPFTRMELTRERAER